MNQEKYLYWFDTQNPYFLHEVVFREMYARIGHIFHLIQMIEYNLANIMALEEFDKETLTVFKTGDIERVKKKIAEKYGRISDSTRVARILCNSQAT